jgi:methionine synthase II (cobalamin-independent)
MRRSTTGFLTTHTGSLPRPPDLIRTMFGREEGVPVDPAGATIRVPITTTWPSPPSSTSRSSPGAAAVSFEASNPRHAHEWRVFERVTLPAGKVVIPGVLDSTTSFIEHPDLVAERIGRSARLVGRDNVIGGTDCGFGTWAGQAAVDPDIVWAKLVSMAEGARRASRESW